MSWLGLVLPWWARWAALGVAMVAAAAFGAAKMHQHDQKAYDALSAAYAGFKAEVAAAGKAQNDRAAAIAAHDELLKEEADDDHEAALAKLRADVDRLRARRSSGGILPPAAPGAPSPDRATFSRAELERALRDLDAGVQGLVDEGSRAVIDLDTAKRWARDR